MNYELERLPQRFTNLEIDEFIVMPDHIHVLFILHDDADTTTRRGELNVCPAPHAERRTNPIQSAALNPNQPDPSSKSALGVRAVKGEHVVHMGATFAPTHRRRLEGSMSIRTERKPIRLGGLCSC